MKRRVVLGVLALVFAASVVVAVNALRGPRKDGPLQSTNDRMNIKAPLATEQILVWGKDLPWDPAVGDIRIESIEPVGTRGLEVLGLVLNNSVLQAEAHAWPMPARVSSLASHLRRSRQGKWREPF